MRDQENARGHRRSSCEPMWPGANTLAWDDDPTARAVVAELGALTLEQCGAIMGCTRERIRQIEARALAKCFRRWREDGAGK